MKRGSLRTPFQFCLYFLLVASPPLRCLSVLFLSSTHRTLSQSPRSILSRRLVTSLWTVDLLMPYSLAHCLTVAPVEAIYSPKIKGRLWLSFISFHLGKVYAYRWLIYYIILRHCFTASTGAPRNRLRRFRQMLKRASARRIKFGDGAAATTLHRLLQVRICQFLYILHNKPLFWQHLFLQCFNSYLLAMN